MNILIYFVLLMLNHATAKAQNILIEAKKVYWYWLHRFDSVIKHHQIYIRKRHQWRYFLKQGIRG